MSAVVTTPTGRILGTILHHLDVEGRTCAATTMPVDATDLERYLAELLTEIRAKPQKREYRLADVTESPRLL